MAKLANRPDSIRVGPHDYEVVEDATACDVGDVLGASISDDLRIIFDPRRPVPVQRVTLLHESLHSIWSETYLKFEYPDSDSDSVGEKMISELAPRLLALLRDNPDLVRWLTDE